MNYEKAFLSLAPDAAFLPDGKQVSALAVYFECLAKDIKTEEPLYCREEGDRFDLADVYRCSYDKDSETGYRLSKRYDVPGLEIKFVPVDYAAWCGYAPDFGDSVQITKDEFCITLKKYPEAFDTSDNKDAQCGSYGIRYIEE